MITNRTEWFGPRANSPQGARWGRQERRKGGRRKERKKWSWKGRGESGDVTARFGGRSMEYESVRVKGPGSGMARWGWLMEGPV